MKIQNSIRFALVALIASILFNTIAFGQKDGKTPMPNASGGNGNGNGSSTVTHDATLTGSGTTASPLGIAAGGVGTAHLSDGAVTTNKTANGAITSSKLAATNTPQSGQALTFNGTNLTWQTPKSSLRIVDSTGKEVGFYDIYSYLVVVYISSVGEWFRLGADKSGFYVNNDVVLFYQSANCAGTPYANVYRNGENSFANDAVVSGNFIYYATAPPETVDTLSYKQLSDNVCVNLNYPGRFISRFSTIPVADLGFTSPFSLAK